jgi:15-cis-phytoene synthase
MPRSLPMREHEEPQFDSKTHEVCKAMLQNGSKSFHLASQLFDSDTRFAVSLLYGWCRYCDDQIDTERSPQAAQRNLEELKIQTLACYEKEPPSLPVFLGFQYLVRRYSIPKEYPLELLRGVEMDVNQKTYQTFNDLLQYCFRVASTVGLMMTHILGISDKRALKNAVDLGIAMQLTNIARDIYEDARMGRVYIPLDWLQKNGLDPKEILDEKRKDSIVILAQKLVHKSASYYQSANEGIRYLPFRAALAVRAASAIYSEIGRQILSRNTDSWNTRMIVPKWKKVLLALQSILWVLGRHPFLPFQSWKPVPIDQIWRHR